jgi:hypothetical protein
MIVVKAKTALALGLSSLLRVFFYQFGIKTGLNKVKTITSHIEAGDFFTPYLGELVNYKCNLQWTDKHCYFGRNVFNVTIPNWHQSCLNGEFAPHDKPWHSIADFNEQLGDIKGVWEASRFEWLIGFAQQAKCGEEQALDKLNIWLRDWADHNQSYNGVNWKCGQEASIRVMHLALAALLLEQTTNSSDALLSLIKKHLKRISPTLMYAVAQDNNHGTSEAVALYIGGSLLALNGDEDGKVLQAKGFRWLENRADRLIETDGSFSQYSVTYHRVMLDTYSLAEIWRQKHALPPFSEKLYSKLKAAANWMFYFTNINSGDSPNLGANDGARLIPLTACDYRDFRPSTQLATVLFDGKLAYSGEGSFNLPLQWLQLNRPAEIVDPKETKDFSDGGYAYMANSKAELYLNYPKFKFRPSQCDALHIDLWINNVNILRDGGTFSYNAGQKYIDYYGGSKSHNTAAFDEHDQMPRLSRFLLGDWLKTSIKEGLIVTNDTQIFLAGYKDRFGCKHIRTIELHPSKLVIKDTVSGFNDSAIVRFRLAPAFWKLSGNKLISELCTVVFYADSEFKKIELTRGTESRYYYQETEIPVLELEVTEAGVITTEIIF